MSKVADPQKSDLMEKIVSLCKRRGFIFPSSEIYGGLGSAWDYGPLGAELKRNVKSAWWSTVVHQRDDMVGLDASILMHPKTWEASGHVNNFNDVLVDCRRCNSRFRIDHLKDGKCPSCGVKDFTDGRAFNLMFKTHYGAVEDGNVTYLRPETAQGIFVNFKNVLDTTHRKLPFGIAQIGKAFRNEVTAGNFTFRMREFEQMEVEYFTTKDQAADCHQRWIQERLQWYLNLGVRKENLQLRKHADDELAHYAAACTDIEYNFPFGWSELEGIANRTDYDLKQHAQFSGKDLQYQDLTTGEKFYPYVIEPSGGVDRATLAFLVDAYHEEVVKDQTRVVLKFSKQLAPVKVAVLPLLKKNDGIVTLAKRIKNDLQKEFVCVYDDTAAIGKLYRRQDEVGTFYCVTVDVQSLEDGQVTVRDRDTMAQERIAVDRLKGYLREKLAL
ncbi:MAG TPA: glycine--tRNA ligase [Candidatus Omnitrophica bacterium]|nr:MAG: glycine--tRNA ligase [Omnitrophica WOR_2 bacterium GWA2_53_43]HBO97816.1 glycine--tRNA ligase [Candidatus Omnitrophota bacterium]HCI44508.1 glycine--tRNA ligase [Candidatus Omnitrophota bacterium]